MSIGIGDIEAAASAIAGAVLATPLNYSRLLSELSGAEVFLKMENLQYTASFKERGALFKLLSLSPDEQRRGVIAMSAGNHALGVAYHAQRLGINATIVMPHGTPFIKIANTRHHGARVVLFGEGLAEAGEHARALAAVDGLTFVHPYDDPLVVTGQGTVALEMLTQRPDLDVLVVPIGGGGLISGCAIAAKQLNPSIEVVGVQSENYPSMLQALCGAPATAGGRTIAEGIAVKEPSALTRAICARHVDRFLLVSEDDLEGAVQMLAEIEKTVAEGAGAAGVAALFAHKETFADRRVGIVVCGGNIDMRLLASVLMRGLARHRRLVWIRVAISDAPGELGKLTALIGNGGGNIVEITHQRLFHRLSVKMAEVDVVVETRDAEHVAALEGELAAAGFAPQLLS